jgi:hypothetical protein
MRTAEVMLVCILATGCGGLVAPLDAGPGDDGSFAADARAQEASIDDGSARDAEASGPPCSADAGLEGGLCVPPAEDILYASPDVVSVPAGSYGTATFVAAGPWTSDPAMYIWFEGSTLRLDSYPIVTSYGSPQSLSFLVPASAAGQQGTLTVTGHDGNIERTAHATVNVTACAPWTASFACAGYVCGAERDHCGGDVSCGECSGDEPYCFLGFCVATMPHYCPGGYGIAPGGKCVACESTGICKQCRFPDRCLGIEDVCLCQAPVDGG